ncbi:MAG: DUF4434 domain-containing protein [Planctomycetes bacterium]|nr:DUF4434 domain-containing protein [Planctomycetota bacterium]
MITATFLDEINIDIPSANWGPEEWARDFAAMKSDGIDTVVLARGGQGDRATFDALSLRKLHPNLIVQEDLVAVFLSLAELHDMQLWIGTYHTSGESETLDVNVNLAFVDEVWERYGRSRAFRGWYVGTRIDTANEKELVALQALSKHLKSLSALPVLVSPRLDRTKLLAGKSGWQEHESAWSETFERLESMAAVVLLQERGVPSAELPEYLALTSRLARAHGLEAWVNVESLDRDAKIEYMPIAWPKLRSKMDAALASGANKLITFEYSHFLSPHSMFHSAHTLHKRYREWLAARK